MVAPSRSPSSATTLLQPSVSLQALLDLGLLFLCDWALVWAVGEPPSLLDGQSNFLLHRPQAQESNYENLSQMSPQGPRAATCSP